MNQDPNAIQYGGDHYRKAGNLQHWDMLAVFGYGWEYYLARASAYLTRIKDPELDPKKAVHFLDKLLHLVETDQMPSTFRLTTDKRAQMTSEEIGDYVAAYFGANSIDPDSLRAQAIKAIIRVSNVEDLQQARTLTARFAGVE